MGDVVAQSLGGTGSTVRSARTSFNPAAAAIDKMIKEEPTKRFNREDALATGAGVRSGDEALLSSEEIIKRLRRELKQARGGAGGGGV